MSPPTIFIIYPDAAVRASARFLLETNGWTVEDFATPSGFIATLDRANAGCLVLDDHLPGITGIVFLEELRKRGLALPVVLATDSLDPDLQRRATSIGAAAVASLFGMNLIEAVEAALSAGPFPPASPEGAD
jgi:FixJ family two-component response regulator